MNKQTILEELRRELDMRLTVYPKWIMQGKISQKTGNHRVVCIQKAIELIEALPVDEQSAEQIQIELLE